MERRREILKRCLREAGYRVQPEVERGSGTEIIDRGRTLRIITMGEARELHLELGEGEQYGVEAREYFSKTKSSHAFAGNKFTTTPQARSFVNNLYNSGAELVVVSGLYTEKPRQRKEGDIYADTLFVKIRLGKEDEVISVIDREKPDEFDKVSSGTYKLWWD